ncbi:phosphomannomutase/phosphoglucomutase [Candidatus Woesearchaeota archaeon]|nr:phosphomannomutase/phosphoglucomutase [Candidatus Woesearchaeota archaeon]
MQPQLDKIFKAYDVRGIYGSELTEEIAEKIGNAFVSFLKCREIIVGYDMRISSPKLSKAFMKGAASAGADVIDIGQVCTDAVYFASGFLNKPSVMFTASHNPKEYNGIKFTRKSAIPINENTGLKSIRNAIEKNKFIQLKKRGQINRKNILEDYAGHVKKFININKIKPLKIAVDAGNGMAGKIIPMVFKGLPVEIVPLYFELDGNFPNHPADPSKPENLADLQEKVMGKKCDFGMAFDGDADRIFFVDENGETVNSSVINAMISKNMLLKSPKEKVIYNLVCSHIVPETIRKYGGTPIIERVGHSFIKDTMRNTKAIFAGEHSAHYYYRDNYRADSGMITALIVTEIVSESSLKLSEIAKEFHKYHTIPETSIKVDDKNEKLKEIESKYRKNAKKISKMDGITIEFDGWWFNVRPSNTEPLLRLNLEADSKELMEEKRKELVVLMNS